MMLGIKYIFLLMAVYMVFVTDCYSQIEAGGSAATTQPAIGAAAESTRLDIKSPKGAMLRSLIFPGWGQWYNQKRLKAVVVFGTEIGLLANSIYLNQKCQASQTTLEREFYINNRNLSNWWLLGVVLFSMADAFVDAHLYRFDESPELSLVQERLFAVSGSGSGFTCSLRISF
ncbi:MAG: DUF5683 domain-containing protein [candidate division KSB1 bacterium]|nr:DUF5683 domain-containing protein [candidate division KSB1 bacterium]MDZ7319203.1 DUF5683 domain-containing protein [candidate division KSB1 bacterium]MDZ7340324.1 DUF5683 domain-containing protein [candidate division KSB1 bacterium]